MADRYGAMQLPVPAPAAGETVADPALDALAGYLEAVLNAKGATAWNAVAPGTQPVEHVFKHNPDELFNERDLPALYVWRSQSERERLADDWECDNATFQVLWVPEFAAEGVHVIRAPFLNAIAKIIDAALYIGRDPSWIVAGDTDPDAAELGSVLAAQAEWVQWKRTGPAQRAFIDFSLAEGERPQSVPAVSVAIQATERLVTDPATQPGVYPSAVHVDFIETDATLGDVIVDEFDG